MTTVTVSEEKQAADEMSNNSREINAKPYDDFIVAFLVGFTKRGYDGGGVNGLMAVSYDAKYFLKPRLFPG